MVGRKKHYCSMYETQSGEFQNSGHFSQQNIQQFPFNGTLCSWTTVHNCIQVALGGMSTGYVGMEIRISRFSVNWLETRYNGFCLRSETQWHLQWNRESEIENNVRQLVRKSVDSIDKIDSKSCIQSSLVNGLQNGNQIFVLILTGTGKSVLYIWLFFISEGYC